MMHQRCKYTTIKVRLIDIAEAFGSRRVTRVCLSNATYEDSHQYKYILLDVRRDRFRMFVNEPDKYTLDIKGRELVVLLAQGNEPSRYRVFTKSVIRSHTEMSVIDY